MTKLNWLLVLFISFILNGCGGGSAGSNAAGISNFSSNGTPQVLPASVSLNAQLTRNLSLENIDRDPQQAAPRANELPPLNFLDANLKRSAQYKTRYGTQLSRVMSNAEFQNNVSVYIEDDMRFNLSVSGFIGGYTGHNVIALDGKFIDILWEVSTYLAGAEAGLYSMTKDQAVSQIVKALNQKKGYLGEQVFFRQSLNANSILRADYFFESLAAGILYHEYGHYYHYHALDHQRAANTADEARVSHSSFNEDQADEVAGMLLAKAGYDVALGSEMLDMMAYYGLNREVPSANYSDVTENAVFQNTSYKMYSSYADRKARMKQSATAYLAVAVGG